MSHPPPTSKTTELGPLTEEWEVVRLGEMVLKTRQAAPRKRPDHRFEYVDVSAISSKSLAIKKHVELKGKDAPSRARKLVRSGDVIFATVRPYLKRLVPSELDGHVCSTAFCVIRVRPGVADPNFLFFSPSTDAFVNRVSEHQRGSSYPAITDKDVLNELIPLPPLPEQQAIAREQLGRLIVKGPQNGIYKPQTLYGEGTPIVRIDDFGNDGGVISFAPNTGEQGQQLIPLRKDDAGGRVRRTRRIRVEHDAV